MSDQSPTPPTPPAPILEMRVALTTGEYERLVRFYREGLGLEPAHIWTNDQGQAHQLQVKVFRSLSRWLMDAVSRWPTGL